ncbi:MAG: hypothetical protein GXP16_16345 [Gammaproteobacteria bacterium]|nr:hypothetical protein [Gammaproteobacteria bacterium]
MGKQERQKETKNQAKKATLSRHDNLEDDLSPIAEDEGDEDGSVEDEFADHDDVEVSAEISEFDDDSVGTEAAASEADIDAVVEMTSKEQSARSLEIRRAIEERREQRQLSEDLDSLDMDYED